MANLSLPHVTFQPRYAMSQTLENLKAAVAGHYVIEREIGSGGMATVCLKPTTSFVPV